MEGLSQPELERARSFMEEVVRLMAASPGQSFATVVGPAWKRLNLPLSLETFEKLYLESCRQAIDQSHAT